MKEKIYQMSACEKIKRNYWYTDHPDQLYTCFKAFVNSMRLACTDILCGEIRYTVPKGGEGGYYKIIELDRCCIACGNAGAKAVYDTLDDYITHRDKTLLEYAWNGNSGYLSKELA